MDSWCGDGVDVEDSEWEFERVGRDRWGRDEEGREWEGKGEESTQVSEGTRGFAPKHTCAVLSLSKRTIFFYYCFC